jgi:hypothetical protein
MRQAQTKSSIIEARIEHGPANRTATDSFFPISFRSYAAPPRYSALKAAGSARTSRVSDRLLLRRITSPSTPNRRMGACRIFWSPAASSSTSTVCSFFDVRGGCGSRTDTTAPWIHRSSLHDPGRRLIWTLSRARDQTTSPTPSDYRLPIRLVSSAAGRHRLAVPTRLRRCTRDATPRPSTIASRGRSL